MLLQLRNTPNKFSQQTNEKCKFVCKLGNQSIRIFLSVVYNCTKHKKLTKFFVLKSLSCNYWQRAVSVQEL